MIHRQKGPKAIKHQPQGNGEKNDHVRYLMSMNDKLPGESVYYSLTSPSSSESSSSSSESNLEEKKVKLPYLKSIPGYIYTHKTYAKGRWLNTPILSLLSSEFSTYPALYYSEAIKDGRITVNGKVVEESYTIKSNDVVCHTVCRHEPPVRVCFGVTPSASPSLSSPLPSLELIKIVNRTPTYLAINKPPTMPIHPCGSYHFNTLFNVLTLQDPTLKTTLHTPENPEEDRYETGMFPIHRLDRLTSGLVIVGVTREASRVLSSFIYSGECEKVYLARVNGRFPEGRASEEEKNKRMMGIEGLCHSLVGEVDKAGVESGVDAQGKGVFGYWWDDDDECSANSSSSNSNDITSVDFTQSYIDSLLLNTASPPLAKLTVSSPIKVIDQKHGIYLTGSYPLDPSSSSDKTKRKKGEVRDDSFAKSAVTSFRCIGYDSKSDTSVMVCYPHTGRTHQIRLHLQVLGYPIHNDPCYGLVKEVKDDNDCSLGSTPLASPSSPSSLTCFGGGGYKDSATVEEIQHLADQTGEKKASCPQLTTTTTGSTSISAEQAAALQTSYSTFIKNACPWCLRNLDSRAVAHFKNCSHGIALHALKYSLGKVGSEGRVVECTEAPAWAVFRDEEDGVGREMEVYE